MKRLALTVTLGLAAAGCVRKMPLAQRVEVEDGKCELVRTLLREPKPSELLSQSRPEGTAGEPAPVMVYLRKPADSAMERFFVGTPECEDGSFRVVQESAVEAVVVYLEAAADGGYTYDARRSKPEELTVASAPMGKVHRNGTGWVAAATN